MSTPYFHAAKKLGMGNIYASIELVNAEDLTLSKKHLIGEEEVRSIQIRALVDTGARELIINENIQSYLKLPVVGKKTFYLANDKPVACDVVSGLEIRFQHISEPCKAVVLPGEVEPLLGVMALEVLNVVIDPLRQELIIPSDEQYRNRIHSIRTPGFAECVESIRVYNNLVKDFVRLHKKEGEVIPGIDE